MKRVIGTVHTYRGTEFGFLKDTPCKVLAVHRTDLGPDADESILCDDDEVAEIGIKPDFRVEVQPWIEKEGRFSFVTSDPLARDLGLEMEPDPTAWNRR